MFLDILVENRAFYSAKKALHVDTAHNIRLKQAMMIDT